MSGDSLCFELRVYHTDIDYDIRNVDCELGNAFVHFIRYGSFVCHTIQPGLQYLYKQKEWGKNTLRVVDE